MKEDLILHLIYVYTTNKYSTEVESSYRILQFFSNLGEISEEVCEKVYQRLPSKKEDHFGQNVSFESLDALKEFGLEVCRHLGAERIHLLSIYDYNLGIETVENTEEFIKIFSKFGQSLPNPDHASKNSLSLSQFFTKN